MTKSHYPPINFIHTVTSAEATANSVALTIDAYKTDSAGWTFQVFRSGIEIPGFSASYSTSTGVLTLQAD